jgi:hypothetical protein
MISNIIIVAMVIALIAFIIYKKDNIASSIKHIIRRINPIINVSTKDDDKQEYPERNYVSRFNQDRTSEQVGYLLDTTTSERYPLYENRLGHNYYYHLVDSSRNSIKIPVQNNKKEQFYNDDTVSVPEINNATPLQIKLYQFPTMRF